MAPPSAPLLPAAARDFLGSAVFASAISTLIFVTGFGTHFIRALIGWPGLVTIILSLMGLAAISLWFRRAHLEWHGTLPISLIVFVGWAVISMFWAPTNTTIVSGVRIGYLLSFGVLGFYVAVLRDTIQVVRAVGGALRSLLVISLVLEVFSGVLIDSPIRFLGIEGNLAVLGPIQGVFGTRNQLGFVALIALITFAIETLSHSIPRVLGRWSLLLAAVCVLLSRSPVVMGVLAVVAVAALALFGVRRAPASVRWIWQIAIAAGVIIAGVVLWAVRGRVLSFLNAGSELETRLRLWQEMERYLATNPLQGWGWVGAWPTTPPFLWLNLATGKVNGTGLSAYVDVYFQLGLVGFVAFLALLGLALARSWLLASDKKSVVYVWLALILVALATVSLAESSALFESGWLLLVVCSIKASRSMGWREALRRRAPGPATAPTE